MKDELIEMIESIVGYNEYLYFNDAIEAQFPFSPTHFYIWAVAVSRSKKLFIMSADEMWSEVEPEDTDAKIIIELLYYKVSGIIERLIDQSNKNEEY